MHPRLASSLVTLFSPLHLPRPALYARLLALVMLVLMLPGVLQAREQWTPQEAHAWYARQPWLVGANYIPANAINQLEMWQAETFDPARIDRELGWAAGIGMNVMRVYLHDLLWQQDAEGFKRRIEQFLDIAEQHKIRVLFVVFDSVWGPNPKLGPQHPPIPGVHNSGWVQSPGPAVLADKSQHPRLEAYVKGLIGAFATDARIVGWDLWNEPGDLPIIRELIEKSFTWARSMDPIQPLTSGVCCDEGWAQGKPRAVDTLQLTQSDVISFHNYRWPEVFEAQLTLLQAYGRPIFCTEYLARGAGSTFEGSLPIAKRHKVAMMNWGLVDGKTQTRYPWDSWEVPYVKRQPVVWHHEVLQADGTPYRQAEVDLIRRLMSGSATSTAQNATPRSTTRATARKRGRGQAAPSAATSHPESSRSASEGK